MVSQELPSNANNGFILPILLFFASIRIQLVKHLLKATGSMARLYAEFRIGCSGCGDCIRTNILNCLKKHVMVTYYRRFKE